MNPELQATIEQELGVSFRALRPVSGGSIAQTFRVELEDGGSIFVKYGSDLTGSFPKEARGLQEMAKVAPFLVPQVLFVNEHCLVLPWVESAPRRPSYLEDLGRAVGHLHSLKSESYGFFEDNFLGASPQPNAPQHQSLEWHEFYWEYRLGFQLELAEKNGYATSQLRKLMVQLESRLFSLLYPTKQPSLLHGDLWSGNVIVDDEGYPCLIDPAVYYGHPEAEFGMTTLFGGFGPRFYGAYLEINRSMDTDYKERVGLYQLYHVLNHLNLFGGRGYYNDAISLLKQYV